VARVGLTSQGEFPASGNEVRTEFRGTPSNREFEGDCSGITEEEMPVKMKILTSCLAIFLGAACAAPAFAQVGKGLSGPHYNLNIIGVPKDKKVDMANGDRHTIFVPLQSGADIGRQVKIFYQGGNDFQVIDGNCTDGECTIEVPSQALSDLCYDVYGTALGKPTGGAIVGAECAFSDNLVGGGTCTDALLMGSFQVDRQKGKPDRRNISDIFRASGCLDVNQSGTCDAGDLQFNNVWIFNVPQLLSYFWNYDNNGLRLFQMRFYYTTCGSFTTVQ